ncbi:MAG: 5-bromo-4-chloroindolyl phosphate hydrolysis family protein [Oscillospiraceae bacterium]|jgi:5-bromo-4-chloroindolyl phosphate hydrolysis protein|nr:5-bromo-4-chloroindolyl phosphate hydrolysis family protein [Oscillospiraceae bacterium]
MKVIKHRSVVPYYGAAAIAVLYALVLPMYTLFGVILFVAASMVAFLLLQKVFPGTVEKVELPPEPVTTGDADADALLRDGEAAVAEIRRLKTSLQNAEMRVKLDALAEITDKIFKDVIDDPTDYRQIRRFADLYLPETMKLLNAYERLGRGGAIDADAQSNVQSTLRRIEGALDTILASYRKQYDALFQNQAIDIEADIRVLETMLKKEGLSERDFI